MELTVQAAQMLDGCTKKIEIHLDYNSDAHAMSSILYSSGIGYAKSFGYEAYGKPDGFCSAIVADKYCRWTTH